MKKMFFVNVPKPQAAHASKFCYENGIEILLSWTEDRFFNGEYICFHAVVDETAPAFALLQSEFKTNAKMF